MQNDGTAADKLRLSQKSKGKGAFKVTFKVGRTTITKAVMSGKYVASLAPGKSATITVTVKATKKAKPRASRTLLLRATSGEGSTADVVGVKATVGK
ncbi:hypothetical protein FXB39_03505 [Nocardioides sp. BGMRC 2183]|nr:hypothetical protein FXB39_03505 [Nocardioides sp. BGMRC 2183]